MAQLVKGNKLGIEGLLGPNKKISMFQVRGLKILGRDSTQFF